MKKNNFVNYSTEATRPCKLCGSSIRYIRVKKRNASGYEWGSLMPVDTNLLTGDYKKTLVVLYPVQLAFQVHQRAGEHIQGVEPHFGTCPIYLHNKRLEAHNKRNKSD